MNRFRHRQQITPNAHIFDLDGLTLRGSTVEHYSTVSAVALLVCHSEPQLLPEFMDVISCQYPNKSTANSETDETVSEYHVQLAYVSWYCLGC